MTMASRLFFTVTLAFLVTVSGGVAVSEPLAPGWGKLEYAPPIPGTYDLPVIYPAAGGKVLTTSGAVADLGDFFGDKVTVLSFMYTSCDDVNGCPLSIFVLHNLRNRLKKWPEIAGRLRFVSLSFDTAKDTPEVLREYGEEHGGGHHGHHQGGGGQVDVDWVFLVAESQSSLQPMLASYSQFVIPEFNKEGQDTGKFSHLLRVFLIDEQGKVRNIYSPSFLHPDILLADIRSVLMIDTKS